VCSLHGTNWIFKYIAGSPDRSRGALTTAMTTKPRLGPQIILDLDNGMKHNCTVITPSICLDGVDSANFTCYIHIEKQRKVQTG